MDRTLVELAASGAPSGEQLGRLYRLTTSPGAPRALAQRLQWGLLLVAALLLASGLIFWIAANWQEQSRLFKLTLIDGALVLSVGAALLWPRGRVAALLCATLVLGGLLAFIGQTYQTGADAWQLFAVWAGLALVWVGIARSDVLWTVWVAVAATGIGMWMGRLEWFDLFLRSRHAVPQGLLHMALWLGLALVPWLVSRVPALRLARGLGAWSHRLALALALTAWMALGVFHLYQSAGQGALFFLAGLLVGAVVWVSATVRGLRDFASVCLGALALNVWLIALLVRYVRVNDFTGIMLMFTLVGVVCLGGTVTALLALQKHLRATEGVQ